MNNKFELASLQAYKLTGLFSLGSQGFSSSESYVDGDRPRCESLLTHGCLSLLLLILFAVSARGVELQPKPRDLVGEQQEALKNPNFDAAPKTKDGLEPDRRELFDKTRADYAAAVAEHERLLAEIEDNNPLVGLAELLLDQANSREQQLKGAAAANIVYFGELDAESRRKARAAASKWNKFKGFDTLLRMREDQKTASLVNDFAVRVISRMQADPQLSAELAKWNPDLQSKGDMTLGEKADAYFDFIKNQSEVARQGYDKLATAVTLPQQILQYETDVAENVTVFEVVSAYLATHKSNTKVDVSNESLRELEHRLSDIWPRWRWAESPEEVRNPIPFAFKLSPSRIRGLLILLSIGLALAAVLLIWRKASHARRAL